MLSLKWVFEVLAPWLTNFVHEMGETLTAIPIVRALIILQASCATLYKQYHAFNIISTIVCLLVTAEGCCSLDVKNTKFKPYNPQDINIYNKRTLKYRVPP